MDAETHLAKTKALKEWYKQFQQDLRVPLPEAAIKQHPTKKFLSVINPAYVVERLNDVFGEEGWTASYEIVESGEKHIVAKCTLTCEGGIIREAFGGNDNSDRGDAYKGACTDALTKAASHIGIAQDIYKGLHDKEVGPKFRTEDPEKRFIDAEAENHISDFRREQFDKNCQKHGRTPQQIETFLGDLGNYKQPEQILNKHWEKAIAWASNPLATVPKTASEAVAALERSRDMANATKGLAMEAKCPACGKKLLKSKFAPFDLYCPNKETCPTRQKGYKKPNGGDLEAEAQAFYSDPANRE